jgi:hypothetical protein
MKTTKRWSKVLLMGMLCMVLAFGLIGLLASCASSPSGPVFYKTMSAEEKEQADVLGSVTVNFTAAVQKVSSTTTESNDSDLQNIALAELKAEAERKGFTGNFDIRNIVIDKISTGFALSTAPAPLKYSATGDVVKLDAE